MPKLNRSLTGIFVRIERDGRWIDRDFTDLTKEEMKKFLNEKNSLEWTKKLAIELASAIQRIGNELDLASDFYITETDDDKEKKEVK